MQLPSTFNPFIPEGITDAGERRIARGVMTVLAPGAALLLVVGLLQPVLTPGGGAIGVFYALLVLPLAGAMILVRRGYIRLAGSFSISFIWVVVTAMAFLSEGVRGPSILAYPVLVGAAAFFWNMRAALWLAFLSTLTALAMALMQAVDLLPEPLVEVTALRAWGGVAVSTILAAVVMNTTMDMVQEAVSEAQKSEAKFRELIQGAPDAMLVVDGDLEVKEVNRRALTLLGGERHTLLGRPGGGLIPGLPELLKSRPGRPVRSRAVSLQGETLPVNVSSNRVISGEAVLHVVTLGDISDEIRAEEARKQVELRLREAQRMEAVGQLAGGVAHDFNNLLTIVLGNASLELERDDLTEEARDRWSEVDAAAARAAELTHQLLAFSRQQVLDPEPLDLSSLLATKGTVLQRILGDRARLFIDAKSEAWVKVDPGQMDSVLLALVQNARDAMPGGGTLRIFCLEVTVGEEDPDHPDVPRGRYFQLCFRDTGAGMDPENLKRAFEPFFTTKGFGGGMGLGLATVHGIVTQSGGFVTANSTPGVGSTFCLYFPPLARPEARPA